MLGRLGTGPSWMLPVIGMSAEWTVLNKENDPNL